MPYDNTDQKQKMLEALEYNLGIVLHSCTSAKISRSVHYKWLKEDPKYAQAVQDIQESAIDFVESKLYEQIKNNNIAAIIFYLKSKAKHRGYYDKQEIAMPETKKFTVKVIE
jgi:hypothetical protein|tara:strand:+ start:1200 stop:1535 length:336 start_codon:yes stop_codon:yes gene_type:complete